MTTHSPFIVSRNEKAKVVSLTKTLADGPSSSGRQAVPSRMPVC